MSLIETKPGAHADDQGTAAGSSGRRSIGQRDVVLDSAFQVMTLVIVVVLAIVSILPIYWLFVSSIKVPQTLFAALPEIIPSEVSSLSWRRILGHPLVPRWFLNSLWIAGATTVGTVVLSAVAGYVFAKMSFPGRTVLFWLVLLTLMLPTQATLVPLYALMIRFGWLDTYWPVIIPSLASPFSAFLMKQYMQTMPSSLIDAARLDGCSEFKIFWRIVLPLAKSALAVVAIFAFMGQWNSFLWPMLMLRHNDMFTIQVGLANLRTTRMDIQLLMASAAFASIPPIVVFVLFQRYFLEGLTVGALKG